MQRRTAQGWRELIQTWQVSELTQKQFCAQQSIAYSAFHYWFKKFPGEKRLAGESRIRFYKSYTQYTGCKP